MAIGKDFEQAISLTKDPSKVLGLTLDKLNLSPGAFIPRSDAQTPPILSFANTDPSKSYLAVCLDLDPPFQTFPVLGPILHWIQQDLRRSADGDTTLRTTTPALVKYIAPAPPPLSGPHRYVFMLYEQPANFNASHLVPDGGTNLWSRIRFDWNAWTSNAGLDQLVAVNYFTSN